MSEQFHLSTMCICMQRVIEDKERGGRRDSVECERNCVAKKFSLAEEVSKEIMNGSDGLPAQRRKGVKIAREK